MSSIDKIKYVLNNNKVRIPLGIGLVITGTLLIKLFAFKYKLNMPFRETYYIMIIPASIGITLLVSYIPEIKPIKWLGSSTLELYAIQMILGYDIAGDVYKATKNIAVTNIVMIITLSCLAIILQYSYKFIIFYFNTFILGKDKEK